MPHEEPSGGIDRRDLLAGAGLLAAISLAPPVQAQPVAPAAPLRDEAWLALNPGEAALLGALVDRLIPADALGPSASEAGVVVFIDRQLAGAWGAGARLYRSGPFRRGKAEQGYQLPLTPREYFSAGLAALDPWARGRFGAPLERLSGEQCDAALHALEKGEADLGGIDPRGFFEALLAITVEGFFADPLYGGNRGKAGWKLLGYPGLPATYAQAVKTRKGRPYAQAPHSIEDFL